MRMLRAITCLMLATGLSGCAFNDQFQSRVARFDIAVTESRDAMILANIVRASRAEPLSFVQVGKVSGTNSQTGTMGLPSIIFGPHIAAATSAATHTLQAETIFGGSPGGGQGYTGNSTSMTGSTSFELSPTETKEFYRGLLSEVAPRTLEFFKRQGVARELLFYLFTDRIVLVEGNGPERILQNDPLSDKFESFQRFVKLAMDFGLSSEPIGTKSAHSSHNKPDKSTNDKAAKPNKDSASADDADNWHLCFDTNEKAANFQFHGNMPLCGHPEHVAKSDASRTVHYLDQHGTRVSLTVYPRSVFAIFQYLGRLIAAGDNGRVKLLSDDAIDHGPLADPYLFQVVKGVNNDCFASVVQDGEAYCVPREGATNTKRILGLLIQLIALNTSISDIPVTPTVRLEQ